MKTCPECGKEATEGAEFCSFCGSKITPKDSSIERHTPLRKGKAQPKGKSLILVDGSNVIWYGGKARLKNLQLVMQKLKKDGHRCLVFVDASVKYDLNEEEKEKFQKMLSDGTVREVPAKTSADEWLLQYATEHPECMILSNDTFQEWVSKFPVATDQEMFIRFMIVGDEVMLPRKDASPLPKEVDTVIYIGDTYTSYEDYHECYMEEWAELKGIFLQRNPEPAPSLLERVKKMTKVKDWFWIAGYLLNEEVKSVALVGYGDRDITQAKRSGEFVTRFFNGEEEELIKESVPLWGEGKSYSVPGIAVILTKKPKRTKSNAEIVEGELMQKALEIVEMSTFPELKSAYAKQRMAKLIYERILLPSPGSDAFDEVLDFLVCDRLMRSALKLDKLQQIKAVLHYKEGWRKGWYMEVEAKIYGNKGEIRKVVKDRTRLYQRRTEVALEGRMIVLQRIQSIYVR